MPGGEVQAGAPEAQEIRVVTETRNLRSRPFVVPDETNSVEKAWEEWLEGIEREFRYFKITGAVDKKDAMIIYGGKEIARLEKSLPDAEIEDVYVKLRTKLNEHFTPKKNKHHARYLFLKMRPQVGETTSAYAARLREKAKECEFGDTYDERILEHIIQTIDNKKLIEKAISKTWDLTRFLTEASQTEDIARQMLDMESGHSQGSPDNISRIYSEPLNHKQSADESHGFRRPWRPGKEQDNMKQQRCGFCGLTGVHAKGRDCPAYGKKCRKCHKWNHYSSVCKSDGFRGQNSRGRKPSRGRIRGRIKKTTEDAESTSSDDEFFGQAAEHLAQAKKVKEDGSNYRIVTVRLNDVDVEMEADSVADVNILDEHQFKAFIHRTHDKPILEASKVKLHTLQHQLEVKGEFQAVIRNETCGKLARFVVVFGRIQSPPLISKETLIDLGMLKIRPDGGFAEPNGLGTSKEVHGANAVKELEGVQEMKDLVTKYSHLFKGIGKIEDKKGDREILGRFHMKPKAVPVAQKPRQVPYYLQEPFRRWLDQGIEEDIFEKVPDDEPITWCSPVVVQPKPKFSGMSSEKLEPHMIRASVDLRVPNKHMERSRISQAPVVEDFIYKFHDCTIWTKLDPRQGYHQLVLHPESRSIATFSTPWGNFRPKRLVFGAKASQDLFDEEMNRIFGDIPRCLNQRDDILIGASNWKEHNDTGKILKATIETEHAVVLDRIKEKTQQDGVMQKLSQTIQRGDWEASRKDVDLAPFYPIKEEIYEAQGLIFRMERIILPSGLQQKIIKTAHKLGHLGTTKTKQMLRAKYWFPNMNAMIDQTIGHCYDCQVTTRNHREEPIKPSVIPENPWEQITIDFGGPHPDGHYNLVAVDRRTRYPEVEVVSSTAFKPTKERLKKMFAHHGVPRRVYSDNGPPFNSKEFSDFAEEEGFQHHRITPLHPRANGQVERFMQVLNKTEQIAHLQGKTGLDRSIAVQDMLMAYRDTPHPATGVTPYQAMTNRPVRTKLDYTMPGKERSKQDESIDEKDRRYKEKMKREGANIKEHNFILGDYVLLRQRKSNKWSTPYEPVFYTVTKISGSTITARRITDGREICRDSSQFK